MARRRCNSWKGRRWRGTTALRDERLGHQRLRHQRFAQAVAKNRCPRYRRLQGHFGQPQLGKLYITSYKKDELVCIDLATEKIDWRRHYSDGYADSQAITPDGKTLYLPLRDGDSWWVLDAATGDPKAKIPVTHGKMYAADDHPIVGIGPHNTWMNRDGSRVYLEVLTDPYVYIADTRTNRVIGKVGPFSKGLRPIAVTDDERYVFANVDWLLGFEIGAARTGKEWGGKMLYRVEAKTPESRLAQIPDSAGAQAA